MDTAKGMKIAIAALLACASAGCTATTLPFADDFERGVAGPAWAIAQQEDGAVAVMPAPGRSGLALRATAAAKTDRVTKADLVARVPPMVPGDTLTVAFDLYLPAATPANSIQLLDIECATCAEGGNPGIRLYLRDGRLRIDRSKIGIAHAWARDDAATLAPDRWHRIVLTARIGTGDDGGTRVTLDGAEVLAARGATVLPLAGSHADRIQIGVTANSNAVPVTLYVDNIRAALAR
jgi:hypothetical protein